MITNEELRKISILKEKQREKEDDGNWSFWVDDEGEKHYE